MKYLLRAIALGSVVSAAMQQPAHASDARPLTDARGAPALDNPVRNATPENGAIPTPMDQGRTDADLAISRQIRKTVANRDGLSTTASNVTIVTRDGVVTLVGRVKTVDERDTIHVISAASAGVKRVDDQLVIEIPH